MGSADFLSGWDMTILMVPFLGMLLMHMFRLDERVSAPKAPPGNRRFFCEVDLNGRGCVSDPDGQPWHRQVSRQIEARLEPPARSEGRDSIQQVGSQNLRVVRKAGSIIHI